MTEKEWEKVAREVESYKKRERGNRATGFAWDVQRSLTGHKTQNGRPNLSQILLFVFPRAVLQFPVIPSDSAARSLFRLIVSVTETEFWITYSKVKLTCEIHLCFVSAFKVTAIQMEESLTRTWPGNLQLHK